jgi:WD40 repeat protein
MKIKISISLLLWLLQLNSIAQNPSVSLKNLMDKGEIYFSQKKYDSALSPFLKAEKILQKYSLYKAPSSSVLYNKIGLTYSKINNPTKAHEYLMLALKNARKYNHSAEKQEALLSLIELHQLIAKNDLNFEYPPINETEKSSIFLPLSHFEKSGDSLLVTIDAGTNDGILPSEKSLDLYTHINLKDSIGHRDISFISSARIISIGKNKTLVKTKAGNIQLMVGDLATLYAQTPLSWRKLSIRKLLFNNLYLLNNSRQYTYHYRFYYYYADSLVENESLETMQTAVNEIVEILAEDTLTDKVLADKMSSGIFTGYNTISAMKQSKPQHLKLFLNFVNHFPGKYVSNNFKFSETYATWIINNTPLDPADVKPYLLSFDKNSQIEKEARQLSSQIQEYDLPQQWFNEGMQKCMIDNIKEARSIANLLQQVSIAVNDNFNKGWNEFLFGQIEKRLSNHQNADSLLKVAETDFKQSKNTEGLIWVNNTKVQWKKFNKKNVAIQNGHQFRYTITPSTNPRYFATYGMDNLIKIWDSNLGKEILTLTDHTDEVNSLNFSNNGRYMASAGQDSFINIYNAYDYSLMYQYKTAKPERAITFSNDNRFIVSAGRDSLIKFRDIQNGQITKTLKLHKGTVYSLAFHPIFNTALYSAGADSMVYKWDIESGEMVRWYKYKGKALSVKLSNDGKYMSVISTDSLITVRNTETHKIIYKTKISAFSEGKSTYYASESFSPDSKYICFPVAKDSFLIVDLNNSYDRIYGTRLPDYTLADMQFSKDGKSVFARFNTGGPLRVYNFAGWDIRNNTTLKHKDIQAFANLVMGIQFSNDDNSLVVLHNEVSKIDLRNGKKESLYAFYSFIENKNLLLNDERLGTYFEFTEPTLNFYDYKKEEIKQHFSLPEGETIAAYELSRVNQYCFMSSSSGIINAWDILTGQLLYSKKFAGGDSSNISKLFYDLDKNKLYAITAQNKILIISPLDGSLLDSIIVPEANYITASSRFLYISDERGFLNKYDAATLKFIKRICLNNKGQFAYQLKLSPDEKILYAQSGYTSVSALRTSDDSILYTLQDHTNQLSMIALSHDGKMLATAGFDSKINLYHALSGERIVHIYLPKDRNCMISDDAGYYLAPKNTLDAIIFSYNRNAYSFDQFDVQLNRPDIILGEMGRADTGQISSYYAAYKKRLRKLGINENNFSSEIQLPLVRLQDKSEVQPTTTLSQYTLNIECSDNNYPLQSLQVLVNNSPVLGVKGLDLSKMNSKDLVQKVTVPLAMGNNSIKVYCTNINGIKSLIESFEIISTYKSTSGVARTYFIGIGVANYKDASMNLQYSAKDIRDLTKTFNDLYTDLVIDTFINTKATRENILAIKKKLQLTNVNDRVIMAVTGHGLLNDNFDFYYATYDVDFAHPEKRGIQYEDLEGLLDDVPAQKKLLLIDACHSGALDKEELMNSKVEVVVTDSSEHVSGITPRGVIKLNQSRGNANSSFQVMQNLFADLSGSNGAVVISAAGGMEYALESAQWNNGVFTYCVRKGIAQKRADIEGGNGDGRVSVQELQQYVSKKVSELTKGRQQPTSRRENVDFEWWLRY